MATDAKGSIASSPLELTLGSIVTDNISSSNDVDYFKLPQVTSASKLTLDFTGLSSTTNDNEFIISVKNASDTTVATTTKGLSTTLNAAIAADSNYYIRVEKGTNFSSSNYSLKAYLTPTVEIEDNGTVATADRLVPNASFTGILGTSSTANASDVDYYAFTTGPTDGKTVAITVASTAKDAVFYKATVVNANGVVQRDANNNNLTTTAGSNNGTLNFTVNSSGNTPKGTYYLKIEANDTSSFASSSEAKNPYTITLGGTSDFNEPPSISLGGVTSGAYGTQKDSSATKTVSLKGQVTLSSIITTSDPDTKSTANSTMKSYYIGLKDTSVYSDTDVVAATQTKASGATLTLASGAAAAIKNTVNSVDMGSAITITSSGNDSGLTFTVLGTLADGTTSQSDVIKGTNAGIATGTKLFKAVTSITVGGTGTATNVIAGIDKSGRIVYDSDGNGSIDTTIGGMTTTGAGFFKELTAAQFATAKYVGAPSTETGEQTLYAAVIDNSGSAVKDISTSGMVTQGFSTKDVSITVTHSNKATNLKEGTLSANTAGTSYHDISFALPSGYSDSNNVRIIITPKNADGSTSSDLTLGGSDVANSVITLDSTDKTDTLRVSAPADGSVEGSETVSLNFQVVSNNAEYNGLVIPSENITIDEVKAKFTASALNYHATAVANTLKYDGLSKAAQVNQNANLSINGDLATAAGSGFSTPHRIAMTSAANDSGSSVQFKITGTSDGSTAQTETINAGNNSTVFSTKAFKTVTEIKVLGGNTQGNVSAGIASILEEAAYSAAQAITYTITADDIPVGIDPLVVNLSSPGITAVFDYGVANQATSREFLVDDDKISTVSSGQVTGALSLVGSATASFSSPHNVTITSGGDDRSGYFKVVGTNSNNAAQTEYVQGSNAGTAVSTNTFKTVSSVTFMDGNSGSPSNKQTAGTVKAGVTDEDKAVTVTVFAAQDSTKESNPHNVSISHAIYQNDKAATAYSGEIANISIPVQDRNLPVGSDSTVQTAKNTKYTFKASDFGYSDPDGVALKKIRIETLEAAGDLEINGADLVVSGGSKNNEIALADISKLTFMPATDAGGSGYGNFTFKVNDGLDWSASANTMKVNVGDSVTTTIKYYAQNTTGTAADQPIKGATVVMKDSGGNSVYAGSYATNTSGVVDFTGVTDGNYTMSFSVADSVADAAINISDVGTALDFAVGLKTPTNGQKVAADTNGDGLINISDVGYILDMAVNLKNTGDGVFRNSAVSNQFTTKTVAVQAGNDLTLDAYLIGDLDGSYANVIASS